MFRPPLTDLLPPLRAIALEAGAVILRYYAEGTGVMIKDDGSPVTVADQAAEAVIVPVLRALLPGVPVVAEEAAAAGDLPEVGDEPFWLVDPLDGTKEFINRNGDFTVNIALIEQRRPVLGVVLAPVSGDLYAGAEGAGAVLARAGAPDRPIAARRPPATGWIAVGSRNHSNGSAESAFLAPYPVAELRARGSSLKFCLVAEGSADLYPRLGPTCEWDTAAGHGVLVAAGGRVDLIRDNKGVREPLLYGKPGFRNPHFVAIGLRD